MLSNVVPDEVDDETGMNLLVTQESVRVLVTKMVKDHTRSTIFKDSVSSVRVLMTLSSFQREENDDFEEVSTDE
jgi:hypothetical protein